jgi:hypothetical protein
MFPSSCLQSVTLGKLFNHLALDCGSLCSH